MPGGTIVYWKGSQKGWTPSVMESSTASSSPFLSRWNQSKILELTSWYWDKVSFFYSFGKGWTTTAHSMQQIVDFPSSKMTQQQLARDSWEVSPSELWKKLNIFACMSWLHWLKEKRWRKLVMCLLNEGHSGKLQTERIPMKKIFTLNTLFWH